MRKLIFIVVLFCGCRTTDVSMKIELQPTDPNIESVTLTLNTSPR